MKYKDLNREQIAELKEQILLELCDGEVTKDDFDRIDELISDEMCELEYGECDFTDDDFVCTVCLWD